MVAGYGDESKNVIDDDNQNNCYNTKINNNLSYKTTNKYSKFNLINKIIGLLLLFCLIIILIGNIFYNDSYKSNFYTSWNIFEIVITICFLLLNLSTFIWVYNKIVSYFNFIFILIFTLLIF